MKHLLKSKLYRAWLSLSIVLLALFGTSLHTRGANELAKRSSWTVPSSAEVRPLLDGWLATRQVDAQQRSQLERLWPAGQDEVQGPELLERVVSTIALVDEEAKLLWEACHNDRADGAPPTFARVLREPTPPFVRNNLRLYYGIWLVQQQLYDEASELWHDLKPVDVVDPASLLFHQSIVHHRLLRKDDCLAAVQLLLENELALSRRYATVVRLMEADIRPLTPDSLDEISRMMDDIRRRLQLGRAGQHVRKQEDEVIAKLDKMIEELEQQQQQASQTSSGSSRSSSPAKDSVPLGGKGPGDVDPKAVGKKADWGNLPPKQREEALQQISKDLPAHCRELIEEYFRKLARDGSR